MNALETNRKCPMYRQERFMESTGEAASTNKENLAPSEPTSSCEPIAPPVQPMSYYRAVPSSATANESYAYKPPTQTQPNQIPAPAFTPQYTPQPIGYDNPYRHLYLRPQDYYAYYSSSTVPSTSLHNTTNPTTPSTNPYTSIPPSS